MNQIKIFILLITVSFLASCVGIYEDGKELAAVINKDIEEVKVDDLKSKIDKEEEFYLIDVRQSNEFDAGNIPGSFNIPRGQLEFLILDTTYWQEQYFYEPEKDMEIIIYCKAGDRGILAVHSLKRLGFSDVKNLHGGIIAWDPELVKASNKTKEPESEGCGG